MSSLLVALPPSSPRQRVWLHQSENVSVPIPDVGKPTVARNRHLRHGRRATQYRGTGDVFVHRRHFHGADEGVHTLPVNRWSAAAWQEAAVEPGLGGGPCLHQPIWNVTPALDRPTEPFRVEPD